MWADNQGDIFYGGAGYDTLIIEDSLVNRGIFGSLNELQGLNGTIDLDSVVVSVTSDNVPVFNVIADNGDPNKENELVVNTYLVGVERIDLRVRGCQHNIGC